MKTRRGLSTVVGMVFAIIALSSTVVYVTYSMNTLDQYNQTVMSKNQVLLNQYQEKPVLVSATYSLNKFNITVTNTGNIPINFTKIWIQNTTATDKTYYYHLSNTMVSPGGVLKNIGQGVPYTFPSSQTYNIKLVTSRGNSMSFYMNSVSTTPLNIQFVAMPPTVPSAFTTQLAMIVTNNSTGVIANVTPLTPTKVISGIGKSTAQTCSLGAINSVGSYPTLQPGQTAMFSWPMTITGSPSTICTYSAQLQGSTQFKNATVTSTVVSLVPATTYSQYSGILTINYTNFQWTQGSNWNNGWSFSHVPNTDFSMSVTNNNNTGGGYSFYVSQNSQFMVYPTQSANQKNTPTAYFIVNSVTLSPFALVPYVDNSIGIANQGATTTLYFGASAPGGGTQGGAIPTGTYIGFIALYGKFSTSALSAGTNYAQTIPFLAVVSN